MNLRYATCLIIVNAQAKKWAWYNVIVFIHNILTISWPNVMVLFHKTMVENCLECV